MRNHLVLFVVGVSLLFSCSNEDDTDNNQENQVNDAVINIISVSEITENSAIVTAEVVSSSENVTERGVVWSTSGTPTVDDNFVSSGSGLGEFQVTIQGLDAETNIQIRAYARTASGVGYSGGDNFQTSTGCEGIVFEGNIELVSQEQINRFPNENITEINGLLFIGLGPNATSIVDLSPLSCIRRAQQVTVILCENLESLDGLEGLQDVYAIDLTENASLVDISALASLQEIGSLRIDENNALTNLSGLENVIRLGDPNILGGLSLRENESLNDLSALSNVQEFYGTIDLFENPEIENLDFLNNVTTYDCDGIFIRFNPNLQSLPTFSALTEVNGRIDLSFNAIQNLDNFSNLERVSDDVEFLFNESLNDFCGLNNLVLNGSIKGDFRTEGNAYNPTLQDILDGNCSQ